MTGRQRHHLTRAGEARLRQELLELIGPRREAIAKRLRSAIQMGDLSENADYHKAKEDQAFLEGRIHEIETVLRHAEIIEKSADKTVVSLGSHVTIQEEGMEPETYHLVGPQEADPRGGRISHESPIGQALLDCKVGDVANVTTPAGVIKLKILRIE
jgi:transcription elongation factor GreA